MDLFFPVIANKIDADYSVTQKSFGFAKKNGLDFHFVSAADGTNVVPFDAFPSRGLTHINSQFQPSTTSAMLTTCHASVGREGVQ